MKIEKHISAAWIVYFFILMLLFIAAMMYMAYRCFSSITVIDESLYVNAARSLHNDGKLLFHAQPSVSQHILYPVVLSIAYFFYSTESIMTVMRLIGTIIYASGLIPVFMLSRRILGSPAKALAVMAVVMFIPENGYALFLSQEVTHFPLMMWAFFLIYLTTGCDNAKLPKGKNAFYLIMLGVVFFLLNESKAIGIAVPAAYVLYVLIVELCINKRLKNIWQVLTGLLYAIVPFIVLSAAVSIIEGAIYMHSGFPADAQAPSLTGSLLLSIQDVLQSFSDLLYEYVFCFFLYVFFFFIAWLVLPVILPIMGFKEYDPAERRLLLCTFFIVIITIILICLRVWPLSEMSAGYPYPIHLRYIYYMIVPLIILTAKLPGKKLKVNPAACVIVLFLFIYATVRHNYLDFVFNSTYDSMSLYMYRAALRILPVSAILAAAGAALAAGFVYIRKKRTIPEFVLTAFAFLLIFYSILNTRGHLIDVLIYSNYSIDNSVTYSSRDITDIALALEGKDSILMLSNIERDFIFFRLEAYLADGYNLMHIGELNPYLETARAAGEQSASIKLNDIVPLSQGYKESVFPLGEIEYVVVRKETSLINAELISDADSALFKIYKIQGSTIEFALQ